jgi:hypothetical protein
MPARRTSPRRTATRPSGLYDRPSEPTFGEIDDDPGGGSLAGAAPWLAVIAVVLAAAAVGYVVFGRLSSGDLSACRTAAWTAAQNVKGLPKDWAVSSTDLNANGMTISILGPVPADGSTTQPAVYASVTCYGDAAATALEENRTAAEGAGATVTSRTANGEAYDIDNAATGSLTTLFRVGPLVGQIAGGNSANESDLAAITRAIAAAMGDRTAAGTSAVSPTDAATGSEQPIASGGQSLEPTASSVAPDLEADLPTSIQGTPLSVSSYTGEETLPASPTSRALAARLSSLGVKLKSLQIAQASDGTYSIDITVFAFRVHGLEPAKLKAAILEAWLGANEPGVKQTTITLGGKSVIKVDYGIDGPIDYVYATPDHVIVIDTADANAATEAAGQIK